MLVIGPLVFDFSAALPLAWKPERGTRIAIIPRDRAKETRWVHTDAFWAWHYANTYEDGDRIHLDFPGSSAPGILLPKAEQAAVRGGFTRATIDPVHGAVDVHRLDAVGTEFPRVDDRLVGSAHRYVTVAGRSDDPRVQPGEHDQLHRYDMSEGTSLKYDAHAALGEVVFAPRAGSTHELDGYYLAFATELDADRTALLIFDAAAFPEPPVAQVCMPRRVPNGLHGNWFPAG